MTVLDSNIWIASFDNSDSTHKQSLELFKQLSIDDILLTEYIILEVTTILKQNKSSKIANKFIQRVTDLNISLLKSKDFYQKTLSLFQSLEENKLSFVDTSLLYLSKEYEIKTFDKNLQKALKNFK